MTQIEITELNIYPIKSTAGLSLSTADVTQTGLRYDRVWGLFDAQGQVITGRDFPKLLGIKSQLTAENLELDVNGQTQMSIPLQLPTGEGQTVKVFSEAAVGVEVSPETSQWFSDYLQMECRLLFMQDPQQRPVAPKRGGQFGDWVSYADECPILLISEASLADLNGRLDKSVTMAHFRPNIVVQGCDPFAEDGWSSIQIGNTLFDVAQACKRCVFTTIDPITQQKSPTQEPLRTLTSYRRKNGGVLFGVHLIPRQLGTIRLGDSLQVR